MGPDRNKTVTPDRENTGGQQGLELLAASITSNTEQFSVRKTLFTPLEHFPHHFIRNLHKLVHYCKVEEK